MRVQRGVAAAIILLSLSGCGAGRDFKMPPAGSLQLGKTTPTDTAAILGEPLSKASSTVGVVEDGPPPTSVFSPARASGTYDNMRYSFVDTTGQVLVGRMAGTQAARALQLEFFDGKLVAYTAASSFNNDSTNFDDTKIAQIVRNKTSQNEVTALLGAPSGKATYPIISKSEGYAALYRYVEDNVSAAERKFKLLNIYFDDAGIVRDLQSNTTTSPLAVPQASGTTFVPIVVPRGK